MPLTSGNEKPIVNGVSYQWIANGMLAGSLCILAFVLNYAASMLHSLNADLITLQLSVQRLTDRIDVVDQRLADNKTRLDAVQFEADTSQDWIDAHVKADEAERILKRKRDVLNGLKSR